MAITRIFKNGWFSRFARKERLSDSALRDAVKRADDGLIDADLGGGVIKQRIARRSAGKSTGYRTLIHFSKGRSGDFRLRLRQKRDDQHIESGFGAVEGSRG